VQQEMKVSNMHQEQQNAVNTEDDKPDQNNNHSSTTDAQNLDAAHEKNSSTNHTNQEEHLSIGAQNSNENSTAHSISTNPLLRHEFNAYRLKGTGFPLLYGYWIKWAQQLLKSDNLQKSNQIYELALKYCTGSIELWLCYCLHVQENLTEDNVTNVRNVFERAVSSVGQLHHSHILWEKYIEFEQAQNEMIRVSNLYRRVLQVALDEPLLDETWRRFQEHTKEASIAELTTVVDERNTLKDLASDEDKRSTFISWMEPHYQRSKDTSEKIKYFEDRIKRSYFHPKPLDDDDLDNWRRYLEYREQLGEHEATKHLYTQALIVCANSVDIVKRYACYLVHQHSDVDAAREVMQRATFFHAPGSRPQAWIAWAEFEEAHLGDLASVYAIYETVLSSTKVAPNPNALPTPEEKDDAAPQKAIPIHYSIAEGHLETCTKYLTTAFRNNDNDKLETTFNEHKNQIIDQAGHFGATYAKLLVHIKGEEEAYKVFDQNMQNHPTCKFAWLNLLEFEINRRIRRMESIPAPEQVDYICALFEQSFSNPQMAHVDREFLYRRYMFFARTYATIQKIQEAERLWFPNQCDSIVTKTKQISQLKRTRDEDSTVNGSEPETKRAKTESSAE